MLMSPRVILPVLCLIAAVALTACGGGKLDPEAEATKVADQAPQTSFDVVAKGNKFNTKVMVASAEREIKISLKNEDRVIHNVAIYTDSGAKDLIWRGQIFEGVKTVDETFTSPAAGIYYFRCDAHPDMQGTFITKDATAGATP